MDREKHKLGDRKKMRIALVARPFDRLNPPVQSGSPAIWIYQIARICAGRGQDTVVSASHGPSWKSATNRYKNVDYVYTPQV